MKSSPRNFRLSENALKALRILEVAYPLQKRGEIVSKALEATANNSVAARPVTFRLLDPSQFLHIQTEISEISRCLQDLKKDIFKIRPKDKDSAEKIAKVATAAETEIGRLTERRIRLANLARTTAELTPDDAGTIQKIINTLSSRIASEATSAAIKSACELEMRLLKALL